MFTYLVIITIDYKFIRYVYHKLYMLFIIFTLYQIFFLFASLFFKNKSCYYCIKITSNDLKKEFKYIDRR